MAAQMIATSASGNPSAPVRGWAKSRKIRLGAGLRRVDADNVMPEARQMLA